MSGKNKTLYAALESEKERENEDPVDTNEGVDQAFTTQGRFYICNKWYFRLPKFVGTSEEHRPRRRQRGKRRTGQKGKG